MADYKLTYIDEKQYCDIDLTEEGDDLITSVLISLLSDRVADDDWIYSTDKRGWWADAGRSQPLGSRLWQLEYLPSIDSDLYLARAEGYAREALTWLVDDGVCKEIDVKASFVDSHAKHLNLDVTMVKADSTTLKYRYVWN